MSDGELLTIGELAAATGTPATTLRYYDRLGLLPAATRVGGQRRYDSASIARLMVITFCRFAGLALDDIAIVLGDDSPGRRATRDLAQRHAAEIDAQIARLRLARAMMAAAGACTCPTVERCGCGAMDPVIRRLRRHLGRTTGDATTRRRANSVAVSRRRRDSATEFGNRRGVASPGAGRIRPGGRQGGPGARR